MHALTINDAACAYLLKMPRPYQRSSLLAIAELETLNEPAYIDADATTAHVVVVRRPGMSSVAFSVADLLRLQAEQTTQPTSYSGTRH